MVAAAAFYIVRGYLLTGDISFIVGFTILGLGPLLLVMFLFWQGRRPTSLPSSRLGQAIRIHRRWAAIVVGLVPALVFAGTAGVNYVDWSQRADDGYRSQRVIEGNGTTLMSSPQHIWRMPTVDELVRSLTRKGRTPAASGTGGPAGRSVPSARFAKRRCRTPRPTMMACTSWQEAAQTTAYYVYAEGTVQTTSKYSQARSRNYRCAGEP